MSVVGAAIAGSIFDGMFNQNSANMSMKANKEAMQNRYQWAAKDMEKAGLNRILALGSPATGMPGQAAQIGGTAQAINQAKLVKSQINLNNANAYAAKQQGKYGGNTIPTRFMIDNIMELSKSAVNSKTVKRLGKVVKRSAEKVEPYAPGTEKFKKRTKANADRARKRSKQWKPKFRD